MNRTRGVFVALVTLTTLAAAPGAPAAADPGPRPGTAAPAEQANPAEQPDPATPADRPTPVGPATARDGAGTAPDAPPGMLAAMQRDLGITADQARTRLTREAGAPRTEARLRERLGAAYAGAWFDATANTLMVAVTNRARAAEIQAAGASARVVTRSAADLAAAKSALDRAAPKAGRDVHGWYVDPATNSVVVVAAPAAADQAQRFARASGAPAGAVRVSTSRQAPQPLYDLRGGDEYIINGYLICSVGFSVVGGFVTAGHCGTPGSPTFGHNGAPQGTVEASSFPGNDYGWVRVNADWTPRPWVNDYAGGNAPVAGAQESAIGSSVCRSGRTTGWRCGTVLAKDVTVNYWQGAVYHLTMTNACAEGGDSGGPWLSGDQAQGVTSGGSGNCTIGGTVFFQPVRPILDAYGLTLVTASGSTASQLTGIAGKCVDVPGGVPADGTRLQVYECNATAAQMWEFAADGTVRAFGMCMDVAWGSSDNGAAVQLVNCNGNPAQQFVLSATGELVNPQSNKCVSTVGGASANLTPLEIWDCTGGQHQRWRRVAPGDSISRIIGLADRCVDVPGGVPTDGVKLRLFECDGSEAQAWTFGADGTIRAFGKCMDVTWAQPDNGTLIQLVWCNGNAAQQFRLTGNGTLVNPMSGRCVQVRDANSANDTLLEIWDCTGAANQQWRRG